MIMHRTLLNYMYMCMHHVYGIVPGTTILLYNFLSCNHLNKKTLFLGRSMRVASIAGIKKTRVSDFPFLRAHGYEA